MAYENRLRKAAYRSPSGVTFALQFDDVERSGGKKTAVHELPQQNKAIVQDLGNQSEKIPMSVYFSGSDYDTAADAFWAALSERGPGSLQHPRYGNIPVLPLSWSQVEKFVEGLGRAEFKIDFIRVQTNVVFPVTSVSITESVLVRVKASMGDSITGAAGEFEPIDANDNKLCRDRVSDWLASYQEKFARVLATSEGLQATANQLVRDITNNLDELLEEPDALFTSLSNLVSLPAQIATKIVGKLDAYREHLDNLVESVPLSYSQAVLAVQSFFYAFAWSASASTSGDLTTRDQAIDAATTMEEIGSTVASAIEATETAVPGFRADPEVLASLTETAAEARASLLERAYSLKSERRVTLATERTALDLLADFYGDAITDIDAALDEFIETNNLSGCELLLIPAGREVVYYA